ncbi:MAG: hypothetical protein IT452_22955 [Planctomycetia bacterium]|nr:hypothetical protein [Planctomycetia bacterium]
MLDVVPARIDFSLHPGAAPGDSAVTFDIRPEDSRAGSGDSAAEIPASEVLGHRRLVTPLAGTLEIRALAPGETP